MNWISAMPVAPTAPRFSIRRKPGAALAALALPFALAGCVVGPDFKQPAPASPPDWTSWRSGDPSLRDAAASDAAPPADWWRAFNDPVLDELERRAFAASPDLKTAALHVAQARAQRGASAAQGQPQLTANAGAARQRQSENGASTRLLNVVAGSGGDADSAALAKLLSEPFTLYQTGLDASWEIDLWGRVRRSLEAADATVTHRTALLDLARLTLASDVARAYFDLRASQARIALARDDAAALRERAGLVLARVAGGVDAHLLLDRQRAELQGVEAQLPALLAQETAQANQIALLLGEQPGALTSLIAPVRDAGAPRLPDLALGLPSDIARRRPDIRAAEARLHAATAQIGVAVADMYPSIRLGGGFDLESYRKANLFDWASRAWSIGPSVSLPLFDGGRRRRVVELRELEQREAAVAYQQTVLQAWGEIDTALSAYEAERQQNALLAARLVSARAASDLMAARYRGGVVTWLEAIDAQRTAIQAARDLADCNGRLGARYAALNKAIGNTAPAPSADANDP